MRKKIIELINLNSILNIEEVKISPFELMSSDEIWLTNSICGITAVSDYRNKKFNNIIASQLTNLLNFDIKTC